jgi:hypothetical protein
MLYRVALADSAKADASAIYERIVETAPLSGPGWFEALLESIYSLEKLPYRCPSGQPSLSTLSMPTSSVRRALR